MILSQNYWWIMGIQWIKESYIRVLAGIRYFTKQMKQNQKKHKKGGGGDFEWSPTPPPPCSSPSPPSQNPHPPTTWPRTRERQRERALGGGRPTDDAAGAGWLASGWVEGGTVAGERTKAAPPPVPRLSAVAGLPSSDSMDGGGHSGGRRKRSDRAVAVAPTRNPNTTKSKVQTHWWVL